MDCDKMIEKDFQKLVRESKYKGFPSLEKEIKGKNSNNLARQIQKRIDKLNKVFNKIGFEICFKQKEKG